MSTSCSKRKRIRTIGLFALCMLAHGTVAAQTVVSMWTHAAFDAERHGYIASVKEFNSTHPDIRIELFFGLRRGTHSEQVQAAAAARQLPCLIDFEGASVYRYAWGGNLIALDQFGFIKGLKEKLLWTVVQQGTYNNKLYSLGQYDSGLALWASKKMLQKIGARVPLSSKDAWSGDELESVLKHLKESGVAYPLDMKLNYGTSEWITSAMAPILQSHGGDLIDRKAYQSAEGVLNGPESVKAMKQVQAWARQGYIDAGGQSDADFVQGRSALSYAGPWVYPGYKKALGADLVLLPMPRFGTKAVTSAGSWNWGISSDCKHPQAAAKVLEHLMSKEEVSRISTANGAIPALASIFAQSKNFGAGGPLNVYFDQVFAGSARLGPQTPAYPAIMTAFHAAVTKILAGADVKRELDLAAKKIDQDIRDNKGYPNF